MTSYLDIFNKNISFTPNGESKIDLLKINQDGSQGPRKLDIQEKNFMYGLGLFGGGLLAATIGTMPGANASSMQDGGEFNDALAQDLLTAYNGLWNALKIGSAYNKKKNVLTDYIHQ